MPSSQFLRYSEFAGVEASFQDHLDVRVEPTTDEGRWRVVLDIRKMHTNSGKILHGGVVMTLLDVALGTACRIEDPLQRTAVTVELKVNFLRPGGRVGDRVSAKGFVRHATRSLVFCEGELRNDANELLATASGTFKYLEYPPGSS